MRRLFFVPDPKGLEPQFYTVAKDGGGLVLVYQAASAADIKAVDTEFAKIFARHFPKGLPASKLPAAEAPKSSLDKDPTEDKEPLLPGLTAELRKLGLAVTPSVGNFILIHFPDTKGRTAKDADALLTARGVVMRAVAAYHLPNALRMTIGTEEANRLTVATLTELMGKQG